MPTIYRLFSENQNTGDINVPTKLQNGSLDNCTWKLKLAPTFKNLQLNLENNLDQLFTGSGLWTWISHWRNNFSLRTTLNPSPDRIHSYTGRLVSSINIWDRKKSITKTFDLRFNFKSELRMPRLLSSFSKLVLAFSD